MKLHHQQIEILASAVAKRLSDSDAASLSSLDAATALVERIITEDLQVEDKLNEEVRQILAQHENEMRNSGVQYHDMFKAVKQKLVRERKLIL